MNYPKIIAISGRAGSGKDTTADILVEHFGYTMVRFADPLKDMLCALLGITRSELEDRDRKEDPTFGIGGRSRRHLMQTLGTEWGRMCVNTDVWVEAALSRADGLLSVPDGRVVIPDCRFVNEATAVRKAGGVVLEVQRPSAELTDQATLNHQSETALPRDLVDAVLRNDSTIEDLKLRLELRLQTLAQL